MIVCVQSMSLGCLNKGY